MSLRPSVIEIEVTLKDVEPKVMRRLDVPLLIDLDRLHMTLQIVIGWSNSHLYEFQIKGTRFGIPDEDSDVHLLDARKITLLGIIEDMRVKTFSYLYDFGDGWEHSIKLGRIQQGSSSIVYPFLYKAEGCCPPEDIGGPSGYAEFLEAMGNPKHTRHKEFAEWIGDTKFDANAIDHESIDSKLRNLKRRWTRQARVKT